MQNRHSDERVEKVTNRFAIYGVKLIPKSAEGNLYENSSRFLAKKESKADYALDEKGRRRFHGAFTGGFSAGFNNTVGSKDGWYPKQFFSSKLSKISALPASNNPDGKKNSRAPSQVINSIQNKPEMYMDEEDFGELGIAPKQYEVDCTSYQSLGAAKNSESRSSDSIAPLEFYYRHTIDSNSTQEKGTGDRLMELCGFKKTVPEIKPTKKVYSCQLPEGLMKKQIPASIAPTQQSISPPSNFSLDDLFLYDNLNSSETFGVGFKSVKHHLNNSNLQQDSIDSKLQDTRKFSHDTGVNTYGFHGTAFDTGIKYKDDSSDEEYFPNDGQFSGYSNNQSMRENNREKNLLEEYDFELDRASSGVSRSNLEKLEDLLESRARGMNYEVFHDEQKNSIFLENNEFFEFQGSIKDLVVPSDFDDNQLESQNSSLQSTRSYKTTLEQRQAIFSNNSDTINTLKCDSVASLDRKENSGSALRSSFLIGKFSAASGADSSKSLSKSNKLLTEEQLEVERYIKKRDFGEGKTRSKIDWPDIPRIVYKRFDLPYPSNELEDVKIPKKVSPLSTEDLNDDNPSDCTEDFAQIGFTRRKKAIDYLQSILKFD